MLHRIEKSTIIQCAIAGALSALTSAVASIYASHIYLLPAHPQRTTAYWILFGSVTLVAATVEILFIYYASIKAVHQIAQVCDARLNGASEDSNALAIALVRAAMELPNPLDTDEFIDPLRHASRLQVLSVSLLYKAKVMLSNFLTKVVVRKIFLRGATRMWLEFIAIPVTAFWNALVCHWTLREARIRALGPSTLEEYLPSLLQNPAVHETAQRAVACCIAASHDIHPNHYYMLKMLRRNTALTVKDEPESHTLLKQQLEKLDSAERAAALRILALAIVIDGKISRRERALYKMLANTTPTKTPQLNLLKKQFIKGRPLTALTTIP